ncbi:MAG: AIR synthase-related protein, partial [Terrimicrobiaceae bacterium]|nr:AIR synthase-related protein [Terrimicrobiaceae bacterium]
GELVEDTPARGMGASHYLKVLHGLKAGPPPRLDYAVEIALHDALRALIRMGFVKSAHDCSEGGLAVAVAESCLGAKGKPLGAKLDIAWHPAANAPHDASAVVPLFNESQSRVVISVSRANAAAVLALLEWRGIPARRLGEVTAGDTLAITVNGEAHTWPLASLHAAWADTIGRLMA